MSKVTTDVSRRPPPFQRPQIALTPVEGAKRVWQHLRAPAVRVGDIVGCKGRVVDAALSETGAVRLDYVSGLSELYEPQATLYAFALPPR